MEDHLSKDQEVSDANNQGNAADQAEEKVNNPEAVLKKNRELLAKLKAEQEKSREAQEKLDQIEQERLAQSGKKDELIDSLKKQVREKDEKLKGVTQTFALKSVNQQVLDAAKEMGCDKPEVMLKLADLSEVTVLEDFSVDKAALKSALERVKEDVPALFKKSVAAPRDGTPSNQIDAPKKIEGMSIKELQELYMKKAVK